MIGLATGSASGVFVVDLDVDKDTGELIGRTTLEALGLDKLVDDAPKVRTPSGGEHLYFRLPESGGRSTARKIGPGVDTRGERGYVIAAGSVNGVGAYEWDGPSAFEKPIPPLPQEILDLINPPTPSMPVASSYLGTGLPRGFRVDDTKERLIRVLRESPNPLNRDDWARVCHAVKYELGDAGREAFLAFSARYAKSDPDKDLKMWAGAKPNGSATAGTVFELLGWDGRDTPATSFAPENASAPSSPLFSSASMFAGKLAPPREWLVPDLVPFANVTILNGDGGTGKSLLALHLAAATTLGRPWLHRPIDRPGRAVVLSAEDDLAELHRRLDDIARAEGVGLSAMHDLFVRSLAGEDALLAVPNRQTSALAPTELFGRLDAAFAELRPVVAILDTLADLNGGEENNRAHARQFIGALRGLALRHRCAVVLLAHPSLSGIASGSGSSGSTAWNNSVRSRLYLDRVKSDGYEPDPDARRLTTMKANYGRVGDEILMTWRDGVFVANPPESGLDRMAAGAKAKRVFLKLLRQYEEDGRRVSAMPCSTYAPSVFAKHPDNEGVSKNALKAAMEALFSNNEIENAVHGKGVNERRHIRIKRGEEQ